MEGLKLGQFRWEREHVRIEVLIFKRGAFSPLDGRFWSRASRPVYGLLVPTLQRRIPLSFTGTLSIPGCLLGSPIKTE